MGGLFQLHSLDEGGGHVCALSEEEDDALATATDQVLDEMIRSTNWFPSQAAMVYIHIFSMHTLVLSSKINVFIMHAKAFAIWIENKMGIVVCTIFRQCCQLHIFLVAPEITRRYFKIFLRPFFPRLSVSKNTCENPSLNPSSGVFSPKKLATLIIVPMISYCDSNAAAESTLHQFCKEVKPSRIQENAWNDACARIQRGVFAGIFADWWSRGEGLGKWLHHVRGSNHWRLPPPRQNCCQK